MEAEERDRKSDSQSSEINNLVDLLRQDVLRYQWEIATFQQEKKSAIAVVHRLNGDNLELRKKLGNVISIDPAE